MFEQPRPDQQQVPAHPSIEGGKAHFGSDRPEIFKVVLFFEIATKRLHLERTYDSGLLVLGMMNSRWGDLTKLTPGSLEQSEAFAVVKKFTRVMGSVGPYHRDVKLPRDFGESIPAGGATAYCDGARLFFGGVSSDLGPISRAALDLCLGGSGIEWYSDPESVPSVSDFLVGVGLRAVHARLQRG